ncbi:MAG: transposase [Sporichthyaceae bacterium]
MTPEPGCVTGGVGTHLDLHVAAAVDHLGGVLGTQSFPTTAAGYRQLLGWLGSFGPLHAVGVEGTGSYGSALARHLTQNDVQVIEVSRRTGRSAAGTASPMSSTRSPRPEPCCPVRPRRPRRLTTGRSRHYGF